MISRSFSAYSSMIRRASSERDSLGGGSSLPNRGLSDGFMARRSAHDQGVIEVNQMRPSVAIREASAIPLHVPAATLPRDTVLLDNCR